MFLDIQDLKAKYKKLSLDKTDYQMCCQILARAAPFGLGKLYSVACG